MFSNQEIKQEAGGKANEKASAKAGEGQHTRILHPLFHP
jgi:hypothetical protein